MRTELAALPGVPESKLTAEAAASLPDTAPEAPWTGRARALTWWNKPEPAALEALRALLPPELGPVRPIRCVGALLYYDEAPVGSYHEIMALVVLRRGRSLIAHVPFIAVDSPASVVGGRANWALPKVLARFTGSPSTDTTLTAAGDPWSIRATARAGIPALPFYLPATSSLVQADQNGRLCGVRGRAHGLIRPARVTVDADLSPGLAGWFPTGRCAGALATRVSLRLPASRRLDTDRN